MCPSPERPRRHAPPAPNRPTRRRPLAGRGACAQADGAGFALDPLAEPQPGVIQIDMALMRHIRTDRMRRTLVRGRAGGSRELLVRVVAEGVEHAGEVGALRDVGFALFRGYRFARPAQEALPPVGWTRAGL